MVINSTNIKETNNQRSPQIIEHKKKRQDKLTPKSWCASILAISIISHSNHWTQKREKRQVVSYVMVCINSTSIYHLSLKSLNTKKREKASGPLSHGLQQAHTCDDAKLADEIPTVPSIVSITALQITLTTL